jgi:hypothetical protein
MGDNSSKFIVVHQQHLEIGWSLDDEWVKTVLKSMTGFLARTISDLGHQDGALVLSSNSVVNTAWLPPARLKERNFEEEERFWDNIP